MSAHAIALAALLFSFATTARTSEVDQKAFASARDTEWAEAFSDPCTGEWRKQWFLDGIHAKVTNDDAKMTIDTAKGFAVLWTKKNFAGDLRIEYDFRRVDKSNKGVNIIYIQATGDGQDGHITDINKWSDRRTLAAMRSYYQNMHTYHVSYAVFPNDYIRGRRYLPLRNKGIGGTKLSGELSKGGLFDDAQWIHITIVKHDKELWMEFKRPDKTMLCHFVNKDKEPITFGRVGLRLMPKRKSEFKNFKIMTRPANKDTNKP